MMKKIVGIMLCVAIVLSTAACASATGGTGNVGGFGNVADGDQGGKVSNNKNKGNKETQGSNADVSSEILELLGLTPEEWAAMDPDKQEMIMHEMGVKIEHQEKEDKEKETAKTYTPDDVMAGGSYKVVIGDYMNSITLYYENGKLVKLVEKFQKSYDEPVDEYVVEGAALQDYGFNFIDWDNASLQQILDGMKDYGGSYADYHISPVKE